MLISCVAIFSGRLRGNLVYGEGAEEELVAHCGLEVGEVGDIGKYVARNGRSEVLRLAFEIQGVAALGKCHLQSGVGSAVPGIWITALCRTELDCESV